MNQAADNKDTLVKLNYELVLIKGFTNEASLDRNPKINTVISELFGERAVQVHGLNASFSIADNTEQGEYKNSYLQRHKSELEIIFQEHADMSTWRDLYYWAQAAIDSLHVTDGNNREFDGPTILVMATNDERTYVHDCWAFQNLSFSEFSTGTMGFNVKRDLEDTAESMTIGYGIRLNHTNEDEHVDQDALLRFSAKVLEAVAGYEKSTGKPWDQHLSSLGLNLADADVPAVLK